MYPVSEEDESISAMRETGSLSPLPHSSKVSLVTVPQLLLTGSTHTACAAMPQWWLAVDITCHMYNSSEVGCFVFYGGGRVNQSNAVTRLA